jgi:hypothetical protein
MIRNDEIPDKSAKNNPFPLENNVLDIPTDIVLDGVDVVGNLDIARHFRVLLLRVLLCDADSNFKKISQSDNVIAHVYIKLIKI